MNFIVALSVLTSACVAYIVYVYFDMIHVIEAQKRRISDMATMLQIAEYHTDKPYYTSLSVGQMPYEFPNWLYKTKREKLVQSLSSPESQTEAA